MLGLAIIIGFMIIGWVLQALAFDHLKDQTRGFSVSPLFDPDLFTPEGQRARLVAVWYWRIGFVVLVAVLLINRAD